MNDMNFGQRNVTGRGCTGPVTGGMEPCMVGGHMRGDLFGGTGGGGNGNCNGSYCHGTRMRPERTPRMPRSETSPGCGCTQNGGVRPESRPGCGSTQNGGTPVRGDRTGAVPVGQGTPRVTRDVTCALGCRHDLLDEIRATEFALCEVVLYLDVYPDCCEALAMYHELLKTRESLVKKYEQEAGPLTCLGNTSCTSWDWVKDPFPWAFEAND